MALEHLEILQYCCSTGKVHALVLRHGVYRLLDMTRAGAQDQNMVMMTGAKCYWVVVCRLSKTNGVCPPSRSGRIFTTLPPTTTCTSTFAMSILRAQAWLPAKLTSWQISQVRPATSKIAYCKLNTRVHALQGHERMQSALCWSLVSDPGSQPNITGPLLARASAAN